MSLREVLACPNCTPGAECAEHLGYTDAWINWMNSLPKAEFEEKLNGILNATNTLMKEVTDALNEELEKE